MLFSHICDSLWQLAVRSYFYFIHLSLSALFIDMHSLLPIFREREKPLLPAVTTHIFDSDICIAKTPNIYASNPNDSKSLLVCHHENMFEHLVFVSSNRFK